MTLSTLYAKMYKVSTKKDILIKNSGLTNECCSFVNLFKFGFVVLLFSAKLKKLCSVRLNLCFKIIFNGFKLFISPDVKNAVFSIRHKKV